VTRARGKGRPKQTSEIPLAGSRALDRESVVPLYFQLAAALMDLLDTRAWSPGARFATEREIEEQFDVSRSVVRPALDLLAGDGAIVRVKGSGAFVAPPRREVPLLGLVEVLSAAPETVTLSVLTARERPADPPIARLLEMKRHSTIAHVTAVMLVDEQPACILESYSSMTRVPWLLPTAEALMAGTELPKPRKVHLGRATGSIELTSLGRWEGPKVGGSAGDPALVARFLQFERMLSKGVEAPLEFFALVSRSDNVQFVAELS
jgi:GntR family transcriptional regulator